MRLAAIALALVLAGCASYNADGVNALNRGDLSTAEQYFQQGIDRGDPMSYNNMGVVMERRGFRSAAVGYYQLAARWGVPLAQQNLIRLGETVPAADLAAQRTQSNAANAAATAAILRAMQPPPAAPAGIVNCTSNRAGTTVQTTCF